MYPVERREAPRPKGRALRLLTAPTPKGWKVSIMIEALREEGHPLADGDFNPWDRGWRWSKVPIVEIPHLEGGPASRNTN